MCIAVIFYSKNKIGVYRRHVRWITLGFSLAVGPTNKPIQSNNSCIWQNVWWFALDVPSGIRLSKPMCSAYASELRHFRAVCLYSRHFFGYMKTAFVDGRGFSYYLRLCIRVDIWTYITVQSDRCCFVYALRFERVDVELTRTNGTCSSRSAWSPW